MVRPLAIAWLVAFVILVAATLLRIEGHEARELDARGAWQLAGAGLGGPLAEAELEAGEEGVFELCTNDDLGGGWDATPPLRARVRAGTDVAVDAALDAETRALARRNEGGACLGVGQGTIQLAGRYTVSIERGAPSEAAPTEAAPSEAAPSTEGGQAEPRVLDPASGVQVRGRIVARRPLGATERNLVLALLLLTFAGVLGLALRSPEEATREGGAAGGLGRGLAAIVVAVATIVGTGVAIPSLLPGGPTFGLVAGLALGGVEVVLAWGLVRWLGPGGAARHGSSAHLLALSRPAAPWMAVLGFLVAPVVGLGLRQFALWALRHVEATGEAPIEAFVSWPSGMLSFGALAVVAPVAEEVFFRGFVFGVIDDGRAPRRALAFVLATGLFAVAHLQQVWGNWGGLLAVSVAGLVFTTLRAVSGSTLVSAVAHLAYNALLSIAVLTAS